MVWSWDGGVRALAHTVAGEAVSVDMGVGGPLGLLVIAATAGVISGVAEALGAFFFSDVLFKVLIYWI